MTSTQQHADPSVEDDEAPAECVGPFAVPAGVIAALRSLCADTGADELHAWWVCAAVLMRRLPGAAGCRAQVICGAHGAVTPPDDAGPDPATGFRAALRGVAQAPPEPAGAGDIPVDVTILITADGTELYVETMTPVVDDPVAEGWARLVRTLLTAMVHRPDEPVAALPLVDDDERERILHGLYPHRVPRTPFRTVAQPFEEQAERTPDAVALVTEDGGTVSYRELNERANRLAHHLISRGAGPGERVGIRMDRGVAQIIAIYAVVKTGAGYIPLDVDLPDARLALMLADAAPLLVLTNRAGRKQVPDGAWQVVDVEADAPAWEPEPVGNPVAGTAGGLLHVLYTSGTTGQPKGVAVVTAAALANIDWMQRQYPYAPGDCAIFKTSPGFDVSIWELFWPLHHGARLLICEPGRHRDPAHLARLIERHGVTMIFTVPTVLTPLLQRLSPTAASALRWVVSGGESMPPWLRDAFHATLPATTLVNAFGPTEAGSVTDNVIPHGSTGPTVPVGRPAPNFRIVLLDENLGLTPVGAAGEAYIGGEVGLAYGYWRSPCRTAERFVADPYGPPGSRLYRTGDLCRYRENGLLEHLGRIDRQVKVRGRRIEPGEVESVLVGHPSVVDCAVLAHGNPARLLAFVVLAGPEATVQAVDEHALAHLPDYLRPDRIVAVPEIPATVNGKTDEEALLRAWTEESAGRDAEAPVDDLEAALVEIYRRVLNVGTVGVQDTFVQLGGHSLLAFELLDECEARLRAKPEVTVLLTSPLREVAASLRTGASAERPTDEGFR
ncbi:non-ribosomal peptide synthetase [Micromonospora sp. NPDC126480]|uniref:non-ribosomal peptide synthetase n=1 Tax=Micromonospora sp. NPDC126480 TaxID=3155312 RepID=UPI00331CC9A8